MCGIFAYLNHLTPKTRKEILDLLIKGLQRYIDLSFYTTIIKGSIIKGLQRYCKYIDTSSYTAIKGS